MALSWYTSLSCISNIAEGCPSAFAHCVRASDMLPNRNGRQGERLA